MSDLISRQAAIDALDVLCQEHRYKIPGKGETYSQYNEAWQDALDRAEGAIFNLPPAQPETHDKRTETHACDSISRQAATDALRKMQTYKLFSGDDMLLIDQAGAMTELMMLPSAQPEIIRCKDCKHFEYDHVENVNGIPLIVSHEICMRWGDGVKTSENGYCFLAERREVTE